MARKKDDIAAIHARVLATVGPQIKRSAAERDREEAIDRAAKRRGRYYRGVARRIAHGILTQDEITQLRDDKRRLNAMREKLDL